MLKIQKIVHKNYYQEIDSIRAIAVLLVVFFHFEMFNFTGGFLGVDIFFVLSGFLITKILSETEKQGFWLLFFFNKRLRRILPALYLVIIISTIFAFVQFTPYHIERFPSSIITSTFGISNLFFWQESGYFDYSKMYKPLLHTWSLSVELQLYLFWGFFYYLLINNFKRFEIFIVSIIILISLFFSILYSGRSPGFFYFTGFRLYEFAFGSLAYLLSTKYPNKYFGDLSFFICLIVIILSCQIIGETFDYNSLLSLIVVLASFVILLSLKNINLFKIALRNNLLTNLGRISYSLYLVHWPILIFYHYSISTSLNYIDKIFLVILSVVVAYISYQYIEVIFRKREKKSFSFSNKKFIILLISSIMLIYFVGNNLINTQNKFKKISDNDLKILKQLKTSQENRISVQQINDTNKEIKIFMNSDKPNTLIIGDSHAFDVYWSLYKNNNIRNKTNLLLESRGWNTCFSKNEIENILTRSIKKIFKRYDKSQICKKELSDKSFIENIYNADYIILVNRWKIESKFDLISSFIKTNSKQSSKIIYINNIDIFEHVPSLYFKYGSEINSVSLNKRDPETKLINKRMKNIISNKDFIFIDRSDFFCNEERCLLYSDNKLLFRDIDHITEAGAIYMGKIFQKLKIFD